MGTTDKQFEAYQKILLRHLERAKEEIAQIAKGAASKQLDILIKDIEDNLKNP